MKPTNKLPTPSKAGLPDNILREVNQAVASSLQHDEGRPVATARRESIQLRLQQTGVHTRLYTWWSRTTLSRQNRCTLGMVSTPWLTISATLIALCLDACACTCTSHAHADTYPDVFHLSTSQGYSRRMPPEYESKDANAMIEFAICLNTLQRKH